MLITQTFLLLTGVFTFAMLERGMCLCFFCFFFPFFGVELFFAHFTAIQMKNVIPIQEARLVWPSSSNDLGFRFFLFLF